METRSFSDYLRGLDDAGLLALFQARPDLVSPVPPDIASLAVRACSAPSVARALDTLNQWHFQVLEAAAVLHEPFAEKNVVALTEKAANFVIPQFIERGLLYPSDDGLRLPNSLREVLGNEAAGLGPASMAKLSLKKIDEAPESAKKVLERLIWGPPRGSVGDIRDPGPGVAWLLKENFLVPLDQRTVILPREVGIHLRGGKVHAHRQVTPPVIEGLKRDVKNIELAAVANIATILRWADEALEFWAEEPADALRSGGLGVRDLKTIAGHMGIDESCAAFIAELVYLAGLITIDADDRILPTNYFDIWLTQNPSDRWLALAAPWLTTSRVSGLVGRAEAKNTAALGPELDRVNAASTRKLVLSLLSQNPGIEPEIKTFTSLVQWWAPSKRNPGLQEEMISWTLREAEWLGITGQGCISKYGREFLDGGEILAIDQDLPSPVDHILIQSDNTAIAPGPLVHDVASVLAIIGDIESRGGATVYRFSEKTIRRGLDHGKTGDEILVFLRKTSKTPVPQPLEYLITDVAKKHGQLRVGNTSSFVRCEDPALITQIANDKRLEMLGMRRIAPEVMVCDMDAHDVMNVLRNAGYLPSVESKNGLMLTGQRSNRAKSKARLPRIIGEVEVPTDLTLAAALRSIRVGEKSSRKQSTLRNISQSALGALPRTTANETLDLLSKYIQEQKSLSIGYADNNGSVSHRIIDPVKVSAGSLIARDHGTGEMQTFRIPRITGVAPL